MPRVVHEFREPSRFVVGTIGRPGERAFFLQVSAPGRTVTVGCEKQQAAILGERMGALLDEVASRTGLPLPPPATTVADLEPLELPVDPEFRVGTMGLGWDGEARSVVVELLAADGQEPDESVILSDSDEGPDALRVYLDAEQARQFVLRSERVVAAGRSTCPLCSEPMGREGHVCIRLNGYRRRSGTDLAALLDS